MQICFGPIGWLQRPELYPDDLPPDWRTAYLGNEACAALLPWADWGGAAVALTDIGLEDLSTDFELWLEWPGSLPAGLELPPPLLGRARGWLAMAAGAPDQALALPIRTACALESGACADARVVTLPAAATLRQQAAWLRPWLASGLHLGAAAGLETARRVVLLTGERIPPGRLQELAELPALLLPSLAPNGATAAAVAHAMT